MPSSELMAHLERLVACDTQNPPRAIDGDAAIFRYCSEVVGSDFRVELYDHGDGHVSWYAVRGQPSVLFNVHLDTVPNGEGWSSDPLSLRVADGRAYGRGSCDIKGAAAALLTIAAKRPDHMALLFTSDEEGAGGCCVQNFLDAGGGEPYSQVVVAEPTGCRAVLGHRGFLSVKTWFEGEPGHSSEARALNDSALHQASRWAAASLDVAASRKRSANDPGSCLNLGILQGGSKSNVIAGDAFVHWSARLRPGESNDAFLDEIRGCLAPGSRARWEVPFKGEPLPAGGRDSHEAAVFCRRHGLPEADPVDFWTEASLFSAAGLPALVLGPGDIAQAHAVDEWVALEQLGTAQLLYEKVVKNDG